MTQTRINDFRLAVVTTIKIILPALRSCEEQFGRFNLEDLETTSVAAPGVRVAVLDADIKVAASGQCDVSLRCAAFIIADGRDRDVAAWAMAEALAISMAPTQRWGLVSILPPTGVRIQPVVSGTFKRRAVTLLAVEWKQDLLALGDNIFDAQGALIEGLYLNGDLLELEDGNA